MTVTHEHPQNPVDPTCIEILNLSNDVGICVTQTSSCIRHALIIDEHDAVDISAMKLSRTKVLFCPFQNRS